MFDRGSWKGPRREDRPARFLTWMAGCDERRANALQQDLLRYHDRGVLDRDGFRIRPPRYDALANPGQSMSKTGLFENILKESKGLLPQHDHGQPGAIDTLESNLQTRFAKQMRTAKRCDSVAPNDNVHALRVAVFNGYGVTTMPAYVTSMFRSQVFSYFRVAAS
jgi:hypothetical protein